MKTRLHSSRIRTACSLTVSPSMLCVGGCTWSGGGVPGPGGVPGSRGVYLLPGGCVPGPRVYLVPGGVPGPGGCTWSRSWEVCLVLGGVPGSRGCTWSQGVGPGPRGFTWSRRVPGLGAVSAPGPGGSGNPLLTE